MLRGRRAKYEEFWALKDVSFEVAHGATLGIIGSNGSGKTTMLKCLTGIYTPDMGTIKIDGKLAALLELGAGFHPELIGAVVLVLLITYTNVSEYKLLSNTMSPTLVNVRYLSANCNTGSVVLDPVA